MGVRREDEEKTKKGRSAKVEGETGKSVGEGRRGEEKEREGDSSRRLSESSWEKARKKERGLEEKEDMIIKGFGGF
ncbi:hypothetical protein SLA2020_084130 [Shorea laevis]